MANWNLPVITSTYLEVLNELKARDVDAATMNGVGANQPVGAMHWSRPNKAFYEWNGSAHVVQVIGVLGGGTGASDIGTARNNLGLGTMATQNANAVAISGGSFNVSTGVVNSNFTIAAVSVSTPAIGLQMHNHITFAQANTWNIGSNGSRPNVVYIANALVLPVGYNKFATG